MAKFKCAVKQRVKMDEIKYMHQKKNHPFAELHYIINLVR